MQRLIMVRKLRFTAVLTGDNRATRAAIDKVGCLWQWDPRAKCYLIPITAAQDVLAELKFAGCQLVVGGRPNG